MTFKLNKPVGSDMPVDEDDIRNLKIALNHMGYYIPPEDIGITRVADREMFEALKAFQRDNDLRPMGEVRPGDDTDGALRTGLAQMKGKKYRWKTVGDARVRSSHAALDGEIRTFGEGLDPGEEPNCRCSAESISTDFCDEERKAVAAAQKQVRDLSERLNDLLLQLNDLREEHNALIENARG